jgi:hypothetical protein
MIRRIGRVLDVDAGVEEEEEEEEEDVDDGAADET